MPDNFQRRTGFMVLHGNRLEDLRDLVTHFLKSQPLPPLQPEVFLVQSNGMKNWLEMALSSDDALGICAATRMELPASYLWQIYRSVLGINAVPHQMPFDKTGLVWRLMRLLPALAGENAVYAPLARYLSGGADDRRLYQLAQQIADVLDGYQSYRSDWLNDWAAGSDCLRSHDGKPVALEAAHAWQAQLWRDIRLDVGERLADASRSTVHAQFMQKLKALVQAFKASGQVPTGFPPRMVVFGISSLSMQTVEALALIGQISQVLMFVQNPCQYYWGDIVEGHDLLRQQVRQRQLAKPPHTGLEEHGRALTPTHPLLASWGKQGRDYLHLLDDFDRVEEYRDQVGRVDAFVDPVGVSQNPTQLAQLQSAILHLDPLPAEAVALSPGDDSITFVTTHSAQREVEVLHDKLLTWFEANPDLHARDVMVMVPDMEAFAPHIHAVFGRFARGQARHIPYSVADTTARQTPIVKALELLLSLPTSRVSLVDWLSLLEVSAIKHRFGLDPTEVDQLQTWLATAGVRWGLDAKHRQAWGVSAEVSGGDQNTWAFGLRRLLLGYAVGQGSAWGGTLPQAAIRSLDAPLVSKLLNCVDAISLTLTELHGEKSPDAWSALMEGLVGRFFEATDDSEERLIQRVLEPLEIWQKECDEAQFVSALSLNVVREHWLSQISEGGLHQRFFGGGVQFGTLMPMRSIPFKAICLLGMNDGDYPRQTSPRDFDLMAQSWRAGDRSRREDDRYLFLEAILSARERLYISWQGHRATDNTEQPPSVLVAQLIDYLNTGWSPKQVAQQQPLQPYSEAYFLKASSFQTFDQEWARVHGHSTDEGETPDMSSEVALPTTLTLDDLRQLVRQPVEVFFRSRLRVHFDDVIEAQQELEPFALNGLENYQIGQSLLNADDASRALAELKLSGSLPMAAFGDRQVAKFERELDVVLERQSLWRAKFPFESPALSIALDINGTPVTGTLHGLWSAQESNTATATDGSIHSCLQISQRLGAVLEGTGEDQCGQGHILAGLWVNHLAACASGIRLTSAQLGLDGQVIFAPMTKEDAIATLQGLVEAYWEAWKRPLPVACKTAWAYLQAQAKAERVAVDKPDKVKDPHEVAQAKFEGGFKRESELTSSAYLTRAFDSYLDIEEELPMWADRLYGAMAALAKLNLNLEVEAAV
jgi:exodeoxyribonuclease V gamma subunit